MTPSTESAGLDALLPPEMAPVGLFVAAFDPTFVAAEGLDAQAQALSWSAFLGRNLLTVTIGNMIGGSLLVGGV